MLQTLQEWMNSDGYEKITNYTLSYKQNSKINYTLYIKFIKPPEDFFVPLQDRFLVIEITKKDSNYFIDKILYKGENKSTIDNNDSNTSAPSEPLKVIIDVATYLINDDIDGALSLFSKDIWLQNYNMLFSKESLKNFFLEWKKNNLDISSVDDVIDRESLSLVDVKKHNYFDNSELEFADFFQVAIVFKRSAFVPGEPNLDRYIFIVEAYSNNLDKFRIVGVTQAEE